MRTVLLAALLVVALTAGAGRLGITADTTPPWTPPRTPWGHPDIQGIYTNRFESFTPLERPEQFAGRRLEDVTRDEVAALRREILARRVPATGVGDTWPEDAIVDKASQPWLIVDPPDGTIPPVASDAVARLAAEDAAAESRRGRADTYLQRTLYERCITRGLPGSMIPNLYGNSYEILQTPDLIAIRYEMIHETRLIPLNRNRHVGGAVRLDMGDAIGRWDGNTLVVETTNFTDRSAYRSASGGTLVLTERFTPVGPDKLMWRVTVDDPMTWSRPWTLQMPLTRDASQPIFEYACHEGNYAMGFMLSVARDEERPAARARLLAARALRRLATTAKGLGPVAPMVFLIAVAFAGLVLVSRWIVRH